MVSTKIFFKCVLFLATVESQGVIQNDFQVQKNQDIVVSVGESSLISSVYKPSGMQCMTVCSSNSNCKTAVYDNSQGRLTNCFTYSRYFKTSELKPSNTGVLYGKKSNNALNWATNSYGIYATNTDLRGQDLSNSIQGTFKDCLALCAATSTCTHISYGCCKTGWWTPGTCWLKKKPRSQNTASPLSHVQSAILNQNYVYPANPGNIDGSTDGNPGGWIKNSLGYYVSGWDSLDANVIWNGYIDNLTKCMTRCQETPNCIYVTYTVSNSNCWLCQNYLNEARTVKSPSFSVGVIIQNPLITNKYY